MSVLSPRTVQAEQVQAYKRARDAAMAGIASVLDGPVRRNNKAQTRLVLQAVAAREDVLRAAVLGPDGKVFAEAGVSPDGPSDLLLAIGDTGMRLRVSFPTIDGQTAPSARPDWLISLVAALVAALAGACAVGIWSRRRQEQALNRAKMGFASKMELQKQMFANLTEAYNELVIDLTMHTHQRQLERRRFFADIEKQKSELITARDAALAEAMARSRFFAGMTHELRTPMNAIMGFSEAIEKQIFGPDQMDRYSDYAHDIRISAQHLLDTINQLLDLAKAESGKLELDDETLDIASIIEDCIGMLRRLAENAQVTLSFRPGQDLSPYRADRRILRQILINLLSNAIKFTPAGGEVTVEAHADAADDLAINVRDNGKGIAEEDLANVFEPFVQGRIQGSSPGTGLGLPLSRTFAQLHGGELMIESTLGLGTTASLLLPSWRWRRTADLHATPVTQPVQPGDGAPARQQVAALAGPPQSIGSRSAQLK